MNLMRSSLHFRPCESILFALPVGSKTTSYPQYGNPPPRWPLLVILSGFPVTLRCRRMRFGPAAPLSGKTSGQATWPKFLTEYLTSRLRAARAWVGNRIRGFAEMILLWRGTIVVSFRTTDFGGIYLYNGGPGKSCGGELP